MDYRTAEEIPGGVALWGLRCFSAAEIFESGQCFRWEREPDTEDGVSYRGIALGRALRVIQQGDSLLLLGTDLPGFRDLWKPYFDLDRDYASLRELFQGDPVLARAVAFCPGMRVLRQDPWEALCSFILSQNNNIKRIKGLVERLCAGWGAPIPAGPLSSGGGPSLRAFPSPQVLAALEPEDLAPVRAGFRAKYLVDAARRVASGQIPLWALYEMELGEARSLLQTIRGVGPKVAECALLYGWGRAACFPVDVWIKRVLEEFYPGGFPPAFAPWAGLAQQYLFHFIRLRDRETV